MLRRRQAAFLRESVVLTGFLSGVWIALRFNPGVVLLSEFRAIVEAVTADPRVELVFALLPLAIFVVTLVVIYRRGRWLGLLAVLVAFEGGARVVAAPSVALAVLAIALALGYFAAR